MIFSTRLNALMWLRVVDDHQGGCTQDQCSQPVVPPYAAASGYWHQRADDRLGDPPPKVDPGAFSGQRQGWKTLKRTLWQCTGGIECLCVFFFCLVCLFSISLHSLISETRCRIEDRIEIL